MTGIAFAAIAALGDVLGGALVLARPARERRILSVLVGFGAGFMLAVAILEMIPAAIEVEGGLIAILAGYLIVHLTQHSLTPHFHFGEETHQEAMVSPGIGVWALVGLVPHSFFDGVAIAGAFLQSSELGALVFAAIVLHKVPTGVSLASVMLASGNTRGRSLGAVVAMAVATVVGAALTPAVGVLAIWGLGLAAGVTIYVAASNLIPESQHERGWLAQAGIFAGVIAFFLIKLATGGLS
ncbi:MAG: ZIP family metal transporter [Gemmatimonadetes bacterium]|nr:ZIP family metal transporter [Gemmatimonadota bacterium]